ncbi:MAG: hypothetical protein ACRDFS_04415, partial [Chloroflexota bacterium]
MPRLVRALTAAILAAAFVVPTLSHAATQSAGLGTVYIHVTPSSIGVVGSLTSGAVNVRIRTTGTKDAAVLLIRLNPGVTPAKIQAFTRSKASNDLNNVTEVMGALVMDSDAPRGITALQVVLQPGLYAALNISNHNGQGPHTLFSVARSPQPAALPPRQATVHAIDFGFRGAGILHNGSVVRYYNNGHVVHMFIAIRAASLQGARQIVTLLKEGRDRKALPLATGTAELAGP